MTFPEELERLQTFRNAFRVVHAIDANAELPAVARVTLTERRGACLVAGIPGHLVVLREIHADRERRHLDLPALQPNEALPTLHLGLRNELAHTIQEILRVAIDLELHQVVAEHAAEERFV